jgi:WD40 repeat protein
MRVLKTVPGDVLDVAFSPDSRAVAAAVESHGVFLWNLDSPNIAPVRLEFGGRYRAGGLGFSADGRELTWQLFDGLRTFDRDTRDATSEYPALLATATAWKVGADGTLLVSNHGLPDHVLAGWRWKDEEWVRQWQLSAADLSIEMVTLAPAGDRFAMSTRVTDSGRWWEQPMRLEVRDANTAAVQALGTYPYSYAGRLAFHPAGEQLACAHEMTILVWALPTGGEPRLARNDSRKHFTALAYHPTGHRLFATSNDETVHVFDARTLDRVNRYTWQLDKLSAVAVSPDGTLAAAGSAHGDVVVWDLDV